MACNCPIVATDVGDISEIIRIRKVVMSPIFIEKTLLKKIKLALTLENRTGKRKNSKNLDSKIIACQIIEWYKHVLKISAKRNNTIDYAWVNSAICSESI